METRIVIIGAGYAGVLTAKKLAKRFKKNNIRDVTVSIIDRNPFHTMLTELHEVAANRVEEDSIKISLRKIFAGRKVNVILDTVKSIDFESGTLVGETGAYGYDYLVLAAGSRPTYFGVEGAEEHSFKLWSYQDAVVLKEHTHDMFRKAARETDIEEKKRLLHFNVVGAGFTGVEMAGELAEYVPILCEKFEIDRELVTIRNIDALPRTVPILPEKLSDKVERRLKKMGVEVLLNTGVVRVGDTFLETKHNDEISRVSTATVIWAAGIESSAITGEAAKTLQSVGRGRIKVDGYLRALDNERVYVAGDNMFYVPEGEEAPVPQVVENSEQSAEAVAHNIYCAVTGKGGMHKYTPAFHGVMVCIGGRYGVARVGTPNHMFNLPSFLAMFAKHFINIVYFIQVLGWNKVYSYLKHEFFTIRNCRSFVGGHFSNRTPSFLLVALRVWLGVVWLFEGVMKVVQGWLVSPQLTAFFTSANDWYNSILHGFTDGTSGATTAAASLIDAAAAATPAAPETAEKVGTVLINFDFLSLFQVFFVSGKALAQSALNDYAFKLNVPLLNWFLDWAVLPSEPFQIVMQALIVIAEILIGLALIGGLFTTPATLLSLVLQVMFITTTGLYLGSFWMIFAAIALLINAGKTFGLDYYVLPYLHKRWRGLPSIRRMYLYHDK
jgi:NADH dehydrogenase